MNDVLTTACIGFGSTGEMMLKNISWCPPYLKAIDATALMIKEKEDIESDDFERLLKDTDIVYIMANITETDTDLLVYAIQKIHDNAALAVVFHLMGCIQLYNKLSRVQAHADTIVNLPDNISEAKTYAVNIIATVRAMNAFDNDIRLDLEDVRQFLLGHGSVEIAQGEHRGKRALIGSMETVLDSKLSKKVRKNVKSILVYFVIAPSHTLMEIAEAMERVHALYNDDIDVLFSVKTDGTTTDEKVQITMLFNHDITNKTIAKNNLSFRPLC